MGWWGGGLCDYCVTPVPIEFGFGFRTALGLGLGLRGPDLGLGLDKNIFKEKPSDTYLHYDRVAVIWMLLTVLRAL